MARQKEVEDICNVYNDLKSAISSSPNGTQIFLYVFFSLILLAVVVGFLKRINVTFLSWIIVSENTVAIIERLGKYNRICQPGLHLIIPFIENPKLISWTYRIDDPESDKETTKSFCDHRLTTSEIIIDSPTTAVTSKDMVDVEIDTVFWFRVKDIADAAYRGGNIPLGIQSLISAFMTEKFSVYEYKAFNEKRISIEKEVVDAVNSSIKAWGVECTRFKIEHLEMPESLIKESTEANRKKYEAETIKLQIEAKQCQVDAELSQEKQRADTAHYVRLKEIESEQDRNKESERAQKARAEIETARVKAWIEAGVPKEYFMHEKHSELVGNILRKAKKVIVPATLGDYTMGSLVNRGLLHE